MHHHFRLLLMLMTCDRARTLRAALVLVVSALFTFCGPFACILRASVSGQGDITPFTTGVDFQGNPITLPDLPSAGGTLGSDLVVGGTGMRIGNTDFGSMTINNPVFTNPLFVDAATIGLEAAGSGMVTITGFTSELNVRGGDLIVGASGQGNLQIEGGGLVTTSPALDPNGMPMGNAGDLIVGQDFNSQGTISVDGFASSLFVDNLTIGEFGTATLDVTDRATVRSTAAFLGAMKNSISVVTFSGLGTRWLNQGGVQIGTHSGTANDQNGHGTLHINSDAIVSIGVPDGAGTDFNDGLTDIRELGRVELGGGSLLTYDLDNFGLIRGTGQLQVTNSFVNNPGGEIRNAASVANLREYLYVADPSVTLQNNGLIDSQGGEMEFEGLVNNNASGDIIARDAVLRFDGNINNFGEIAVGGDSTIYTGDLFNSGFILVLADSAPVFRGNVTLAPSSILSLTIGPQAGTLDIVGTADVTMANLVLDYSSGVHANRGDTYDILSASGGVTGMFANPGDQVIADGLLWDIIYGTNTVSVTATGLTAMPFGADFNGDGIVDGQDLAIWEMNYGLQGTPGILDTLGDADGDGDVDGADFLEIQRKLGGPPLVAAAAAVPEPSALLLAMSALTMFRRRRGNRTRMNAD